VAGETIDHGAGRFLIRRRVLKEGDSMGQVDATTTAPSETQHVPERNASGGVVPPPNSARGSGGWLQQYKPEQGKATRTGTFVGLGLLIAWGAKFLNDRLAVYQGDEAWRLLITPGIPIAFAVVLGVFAWRVTFVNRKSSDFMIATEGEMKKVSWSSKREVIGSTKVVILFTLLLALFLFVVDFAFQVFFKSIGVLKV
jgi:preprotein translocase subunit SecE